MIMEIKSELVDIIAESNMKFGHSGNNGVVSVIQQLLTEKKVISPLYPEQSARLIYCPGLLDKPFYACGDSETYEFVNSILTMSFTEIRDEFIKHSATASDYASLSCFDELSSGDWQSICLWKRGRFTKASESFPRLTECIEKIEHLLFQWRGEVSFLVLDSGAKIPAHYDWTNIQTTCHFGIICPKGSRLVVGGISKPWHAGECIFFDHSFIHTAENLSDSKRVVLLLNLVNPFLSEKEKFVFNSIGKLFGKNSERFDKND